MSPATETTQHNTTQQRRIITTTTLSPFLISVNTYSAAMEGFHGNSNYSKAASKIKVPSGMKTPLMIGSGRYHSHSVSPPFDSYAENIDLNAPLIRYLCSGSPIDAAKHAHAFQYGGGGFISRGSPSVLSSPLASVENLTDRSPPTMYGTPVKAVEGEEVLVMDGVPLSGGGRSLRSASDSSGKNLYNSEDSGYCRNTFKCQFSHGKEDHCPAPARFSTKNKTEAQVCRPYNSSGLRTYSPTSCFPPNIMAPKFTEAALTPTRTASPSTSRKTLSSATEYWSPQDDGIEVTLPRSSSTEKPPSRESVDAYIDGVLSGGTRRRLLVFSEFCSG